MLTIRQIAKKVIELAQTSPDNVHLGECESIEERKESDADCLYNSGRNTNGSTGCIVGQALRFFDVQNIGEGDTSHALFKSMGLEKEGIDQSVNCMIRRIQHCQDKGQTWGEALAEAQSFYLPVFDVITKE